MKKLFFVILLIFNALFSNAQSNGWQNDPFGEWVNVHNEPAGSISISFRLAPKYNICKGMAYSFYRVENTFNEKVSGIIYFSYHDCDGVVKEESYRFYSEGAKIDQGIGLNFFAYRESGVQNIRLAELKFPDREAKKKQEQRNDELIKQQQKEENVKAEEARRKANEEQQNKNNKQSTGYQQQQQTTIGQSQQVQTNAYQQSVQANQLIAANQQQQAAANQKVIDAIPETVDALVNVLGLINFDNFFKENPRYKTNSITMGLSIGISNSTIPLIENIHSSPSYSKTSNFSAQGFSFGTEIWPFRGPHFGIGGFGDYQFCPNTFTSGNSSSYSNYNYGGTLLFGFSNLKGVFEYSINSRNILYSDDKSDIGTGNAKYQTTRKGGGLMYDFGNKDKEKNLSVMLLFDRPDFLPISSASIMVSKIQYRTNDFNLKIEYSNNYAVAGIAQNAWDGKSNKNYLFVTAAWHFTIISGKY